MKKIFISLLLVLFVFCEKKNQNTHVKYNKNDSIKIYLENISNNKFKSKTRLYYNDKLFELISLSKNNTENRKVIDVLINHNFDFQDWKNYNLFSKLLMKNSLISDDSIFIAKSYRYRGNFYYNKSNLDSSFYYYLKSEKIYKNLKDNENQGVILLKKGIVQIDIKDYLGANISLNKAYNLLRNSDDYYRVYSILNSLGNVYYELEDYEKSISNYNKALDIIKEHELVNDENPKATCLNNLGTVYEAKNSYKKAIQYYKEALNNKAKIINDNKNLYSSLIDNLAYCKMMLESQENYLLLFNESLKIRTELNNFSKIITSNNHLSEYYLKQKDTTTALKYVNTSITTANKSKSPFNKILAFKQAALVDFKNSSKYSSEYARLNDSLQVVERKNKDHFARIQLETNEIIEEKEQLKILNENYIYYFAAGLILVTGLYYYRVQKSQNKVLLLEKSQQQANEEIYRLIIEQQNQLETVKNKERNRIAKDLHDSVLNKLTSTRLNLFGISQDTSKETINKAIEQIDKIKFIEEELRNITHDLSSSFNCNSNSYIHLIEQLVLQFKTDFNFITTLEIDTFIDWNTVSSAIKMHLYRIIQEAFTNASKHSQATHTSLYITKDATQLLVVFKDNGKGYDTTSSFKKGIGLNNMQERTADLKGTFSIQSILEEGTTINVAIPI